MLNNIYIETLGISCPSENNCRLYYLTLNDFSSMKNVHNIYWRDLHEHIYNIKFKRDSIHEILFNSLISKLDLLINIPRLDIKNIIKGDGWLYPTNIIINSLDKEFMKRYNMTSSYSFDRNKNSYASTFILRDNDSWISKNEINEDIVGSLDFDFRKSFDFHIEVQINSLEIDNVSNILVHYRFDLHSNPYFTYKQIKSIRKNKGLESETYFDVRQEFINHVKRNIPIAEELEYRRSSKDYLTIFVMDRLYKNDEDLIDFKSDFETTVEKFSDFGNRIVNLFYDF